MAESAVHFLVERLATLAAEEIKLLSGVRNEIEKIREEFQSMKILLRNADAKVDTDEGVRKWVTQVRGVAYEIEDLLDEYFLLPHEIFRKIETRIIGIKERIQKISRGKERYHLRNSDDASSSTITPLSKHDPHEDASFLEETQLIGTDGPKEKFTGYIFEENVKLSVVSVLGEGGLGKTTLVKEVFESPRVREQFLYRAWLTISQTPNFKFLLKDLLGQIFPQLRAEDSIIKLKQQLKENLRGKRYIVVLDNVWTIPDFKELKNAIPDNDEDGSRMLVTTRNQEVANASIQDCGHIYSQERLNSDHSWQLFYMKTSNSRVDDMSCYPEDLLKAKSVKFLEKCCGLPLAIVAMGSLLSTKRLDEWDLVYETLASLPSEDLNPIISLSFNDLPYYLKSCFMYLCMFPENCSIKCSRLFRLWSAQGFVEVEQGKDVTMEEIAKSYLDELIQRSLVQVDLVEEGKGVVRCKLHDVMREFIIRKARDQDFAQVIVHIEDELQLLDSDDSSTMVPQPRHLSKCTPGCGSGLRYDIVFMKNNSLSAHLRSLLVFSRNRVRDTTTMFIGFKLLKALDLEDVGLEEFPVEVVNLFYLRYLNLRNNYKIKSLPGTVEKLVNLQTLDIKDTDINELPDAILKLKQLRNLLMGSVSEGVNLPMGIGTLINLEKLSGVCGNEFIVKELGMLTRLRRLSVCELKTDDGKQMFTSIQKMKYLTSLKVRFEDGEMVGSSSLGSPPPSLRRLGIEGIFKELPEWFSLLKNLEKLTLKKSRLMDDPFRVLQLLPNLVILSLDHFSFLDKELCISQHGFPKLEKLVLQELYILSNVEVEQGGMPVVQTIGFLDCYSLENIPQGINHLLTLQTIACFNMPETFEDQLREHQRLLCEKGIQLRVTHDHTE